MVKQGDMENNWFETLLNCKTKLGYELGTITERKVETCLNAKKALSQERYPSLPLTFALRIIISRGQFLTGALESFISRLDEESSSGLEEIEIVPEQKWKIVTYTLLEKGTIEKVAETLAKGNETNRWWKRKAKALGNFRKQIKDSGSLKKWLDERHALREKGKKDAKIKKIKGVGKKGMDLILRNCGYFDRAPIDFHMRDFLHRTGLFHKYFPEKSEYTVDTKVGKKKHYELLHETLMKISKDLGKKEITGLKLNGRPGVLDYPIWNFCAQKDPNTPHGMEICGKNPRCEECPLEDWCNYND